MGCAKHYFCFDAAILSLSLNPYPLSGNPKSDWTDLNVLAANTKAAAGCLFHFSAQYGEQTLCKKPFNLISYFASKSVATLVCDTNQFFKGIQAQNITVKMKGKIQYIFTRISSKISYPLHLNLISLFVSIFGSVRLKVLYDCFRLPHYAYGIYEAARRAKRNGLKGITVIEFGVANGRGLIAMTLYAKKIAHAMAIEIDLIGFDSGVGMPNTVDFRDHPELYTKGDYPMVHRQKLIDFLPANARLVLLDLINDSWTDTELRYPIGFMSVDVDYYSSTIAILNRLGEMPSDLLLPNTLMYFDDVMEDNHNVSQGELLAIQEFNNHSVSRKIYPHAQKLRHLRRYKNAPWIDHIFQLHVLDNAHRLQPYRNENSAAVILPNKYFE